MLVLKGHFFGALIYSPMENNTEQQQEKLLDIINRTAEQLGMDIAEMAPFETERLALFVQKAASGNEQMSDEDLISITIEGINSTQLEDDTNTEENETVDEPEATPAETPEELADERTAIAMTIVAYLEENNTGATKAQIVKDNGISKEIVASVVDELLSHSMIHKEKGKKTLLYGPAPEADTKADTKAEVAEVETEVEKVLVIDVEDNEPLAEKTNNIFEDALTMQFDGIRELFITELNKVQSTAEADSGYKSQAEQYTEVMTELRAHLDSIQREQGWLLAAPVWQVVALIAQWHPEA